MQLICCWVICYQLLSFYSSGFVLLSDTPIYMYNNLAKKQLARLDALPEVINFNHVVVVWLSRPHFIEFDWFLNRFQHSIWINERAPLSPTSNLWICDLLLRSLFSVLFSLYSLAWRLLCFCQQFKFKFNFPFSIFNYYYWLFWQPHTIIEFISPCAVFGPRWQATFGCFSILWPVALRQI